MRRHPIPFRPTVGRALLLGALVPGAIGLTASPVQAVGPAPLATSITSTVEVRVAASADDAEQLADGNIYLASTDLELVRDERRDQSHVGIRFTGVDIPAGATVDAAWIEFQVDEPSTESTLLTVRGEASSNSEQFTNERGNISNRLVTSASVRWSADQWTAVGAKQRSADLSPIVQEVTQQTGWHGGNAMAFVITGTGRRVAESFDGDAAGAPLLHVEYSMPTSEDSLSRILQMDSFEQLPQLNGEGWSGLARTTEAIRGHQANGMWAVNDNGLLALIDFAQPVSAVYLRDLQNESGQSLDAEAVTAPYPSHIYVGAEGNSAVPANGLYHYQINRDGRLELTETFSLGAVGEPSPLSGRIIKSNEGIEALSWIPSTAFEGVHAIAEKYPDIDDVPRGGFFAVGLESGGEIYLLALNNTHDGSYDLVATIDTDLKAVTGLEWDGRELWATCDIKCDIKDPPGFTAPVKIAIVAPTAAGTVEQVARSSGMLAMVGLATGGFAVDSYRNCYEGQRQGWWSDDSEQVRRLYRTYLGRCE